MQNSRKIVTTLKNRKLLQNLIVRKRINIANFYKENIKQEKFDYIICIPVNGFTSDIIQIIRTDLNKYGFQILKYTRKSFDLLLKKSNINLRVNRISQFYLGHMLVIKVNLLNQNFRKKQNEQYEILKYLDSYLSKIKYSNLIYHCSNYALDFTDNNNININNKSNSCIIVNKFKGNLGTEFDNLLTKNRINNNIINNNIFVNFNNNIFEFLILLETQKVLLLKLLIFLSNSCKDMNKL